MQIQVQIERWGRQVLPLPLSILSSWSSSPFCICSSPFALCGHLVASCREVPVSISRCQQFWGLIVVICLYHLLQSMLSALVCHHSYIFHSPSHWLPTSPPSCRHHHLHYHQHAPSTSRLPVVPARGGAEVALGIYYENPRRDHRKGVPGSLIDGSIVSF